MKPKVQSCMSRVIVGLATVMASLLPYCSSVAQEVHPTDKASINLANFNYFFVGGKYRPSKDGDVMSGQMYVEHYTPATKTKRYPVVMIHGNGQTGTNFMGTPDGRRGWAHDFLRAGYEVYVVDQPGRGRSGLFTDLDGDVTRSSADRLEQRFTAPNKTSKWPQAELHTAWPGSGTKGDQVFDQFYASQVASFVNRDNIEILNKEAGLALLDRIGPAILVAHSQSGSFPWLLADARPKLVTGIVTIEPNGPPFFDVTDIGAPNWYKYNTSLERPFGIARISLTYQPAVTETSKLEPVLEEKPDGANLVVCYRQKEPARQLSNLSGIPILIVSAEASYHASYDHCTSKFLTQAGVRNDFVELKKLGILGNGHMIMIEKNNHEVADFLIGWLKQNSL